MEQNGKSVNPPIIDVMPQQSGVMNNERVAPVEGGTPVAVGQGGTSEETKTIVTVLLLIFVYPVGAVVALFWPKWKWWVKLLVSIPLVFVFLSVVAVIALIKINPREQIRKAEYISECTKQYTMKECSDKYMQMQLAKPSITLPPIK
jgi:hypothetical protein